MPPVKAKIPFRASIFARLFIVIVGSGILANLATFSGIRRGLRPHTPDLIGANARHYVELLAKEVEANGSTYAETIAKQYGLGMRLQGDGWQWASDAQLPSLETMRHKQLEHRGEPPRPGFFGLRFGPRHHHERPFFIVDVKTERGPATLLVFAPPGPEMTFDYGWLTAVLVLISLLSVGTYWLIRRTLLPISPMLDVVDALGRGDLERRVDAKGRDELAVLGRAIDEMATRLRATLVAKERLLVDVSHELRSPLTRARLALEFVEAGKAKQGIDEDLAEMESMVRTILDEARLRSGTMELHLAQVDLAELFRQTAKRIPRVALSLPASHPAMASVDPLRIAMVIRNLLENAAKYVADNSPIELTLESENGGWRFTVRDHGPGMPAAELEKVFEPFYRVDESRTRATGGFGLGLTLARRIAVAHGGRLTLELPADGGLRAVGWIPNSPP